jgi:hypothetical protein
VGSYIARHTSSVSTSQMEMVRIENQDEELDDVVRSNIVQGWKSHLGLIYCEIIDCDSYRHRRLHG